MRLAVPARAPGLFFGFATLPAVVAIALIIPFRVPRNWIEVVMVPVVVDPARDHLDAGWRLG